MVAEKVALIRQLALRLAAILRCRSAYRTIGIWGRGLGYHVVELAGSWQLHLTLDLCFLHSVRDS